MKSTHKYTVMIALAVLIVAIVISASFWSFNQVKETANAREHINLVISNANNLLFALKEVETGERGYLLTGDDAFLEPYLLAKNNIVADFNALQLQTKIQSAQQHLNIIGPLIEAKIADIGRLIEISHNNDNESLAAEVRKGRNKHLMDSIRIELVEFTKVEKSSAAQLEIKLQSTLRHMFYIIIIAGTLWALFGLAFIYLIYRQSHQKLKNLLHLETENLLEIQENINIKLKHTNATLRDNEEQLAVTLNSIGDAVIATDTEARITRLNQVAEQLTGWKHAEAAGRLVDEVFQVINKSTRQPSSIPVIKTLEHGVIQGLANHTVLIARDGSERDIADSCAPILNYSGEVIGAVLVFRDVTKEYQSQLALLDKTAQFEAIFSTVVDGVITFHANNGIVETINLAAEKRFGFSTAEMIGLNFSVLIPELDQNQRNGSLNHYKASDEALAAGLSREVIAWRKGNIPFPLEIAVSEMWLGGERYFTSILRDITLRKEVEAALLKAGALQNAIFNSANFSSIATDANGVIQIFNVGAEHMLGYTAIDVINKITPTEISDPDEIILRANELSIELGTTIKPGFESLVFKASRGIIDIYELTYIRKDGNRLPAIVSVTALLDQQNTIIGYLLISTDNSTHKLIEAEKITLNEELQIKNTELELATIVAEKANFAKSDFLSNMSHELRTPLSAILGFTQLIASGTPIPSPAQKKSLDQILKAGWYLLELINDILDLAVIESGKTPLLMETVSLTEVMRECKAMIEQEAHKRDITINLTQLEIPYFVNADHIRLKQVIINLLSNAIKYNRIGGIVDITYALTDNNSTRINIQDTGAGLTPELIEQLFQPYNRLGQSTKTEAGTGIGLVISKLLVELMNGRIGVESTIGKGSMFWVELDLIVETPLENQIYTLPNIKDNSANLKLKVSTA